eukprot:SAG11_NODE_459_length_9261_cov_7.747463_1_plen_30_part_00
MPYLSQAAVKFVSKMKYNGARLNGGLGGH